MIEIIETKIIGPQVRSVSWPTLARTKGGELLAVGSAERHHHVCPYGRVHLWRSGDEGRTWSGPTALTRGPLDDRDAGIVEAADGSLVMVWFSSRTFELYLDPEFNHNKPYPKEEFAQWAKIRDSMDEATRARELGCWAIVSTDGGRTWSEKADTVVGSPHGPILLSDGRLLYVGKFGTGGKLGQKGGPYTAKIGASHSLDNGRSWQEISEIAPMPGHGGDPFEYHELHAVQAADGRIVAQIRNHKEPHRHELLQTESFDGGYTWTPVRSTGLWGYPSHLTRLRDGRLLSTYSHRREPKGNRVAISGDHGETWSEPVQLTRDAGADFGYPSTVELDNGELLTLWYDRKVDEPDAKLHLLRWRLTA